MAYLTLKKYEYINHGKVLEEYHKRFDSYDSHKIGVNVGAYPAFFVETNEIRKNALVIHKMDKQIAKLCSMLPCEAYKQFVVKSLVDEIQITNDIEGVRSTRQEIRDAYENKKMRFKGIVNKYRMLLSEEPVPLSSIQNIREIYDELVLLEVVEDDEKNRPDGKIFRANEVSVFGTKLTPIHVGLYPEERIIEAMEQALQYLNKEDEELLYRIAVFHYLIGYIHPFYDGNGRLNRFISSAMLINEFEPVYSYRLSYTIKQNQSLYNKEFVECNDAKNYGELTSFVEMFLGMLFDSMVNLLEALKTRKEEWDHYKGQIGKLPHSQNRLYPRLYEALIINKLFSYVGISISELKQQLNISLPTLRKMLSVLNDENLIETANEGKTILYSIDLEEIKKRVG